MFYVSNYTFAGVLCVVSMFCWGSWGNTQKLAGAIWSLGTLLSFVTAGSPRKSSVLNFAMFVLFVAGLAVLIKAGA